MVTDKLSVARNSSPLNNFCEMSIPQAEDWWVCSSAPPPRFTEESIEPRVGRHLPQVTQPLLTSTQPVLPGPLPTDAHGSVGSLKVLTEPSHPSTLCKAPAQPSQVTLNPG